MNLPNQRINEIGRLKNIEKKAQLYVATIALLTSASSVQAFPVGEKNVGRIREVTLTVDEHCTWDQSKNNQAVFSEEGTVVLNAKEISSSTWEGSGYTTKNVPSDYRYNSYSNILSEYQSVIDAEGTMVDEMGRPTTYKGRLEQELSALEKAANSLNVSHASFIIDWTCKGSGNQFDRKRGKVHVVYTLTVMELPNPQEIKAHFDSIPRLSVAESENVVRKVFCRVLDRPANATEVATHAPFQRGRNGKASDLVRVLLFSDGYRNEHAASTWGGNITTLYERMLDRKATNDEIVEGQAYFRKGNAGFDELVDLIMARSEYQRKYGAYAVPGNGRAGCV